MWLRIRFKTSTLARVGPALFITLPSGGDRKGDVLSGTKLGLRIAAGNVPNLVDLETGELGPVIQDPLNSSQTATLATFSTLGDLLAGCITHARSDACQKFFAVATPPGGMAPADTLTAAQNIARNPANKAQELFDLLDAFYSVKHIPLRNVRAMYNRVHQHT